MNSLIDLMIVGTQKSGTTSLKNYLSEHPDIITHPQEEFAYFTDDRSYEKGIDLAYRDYGIKGTKEQKIVTKNVTMMLKEEAVKRLCEHNPACHLVVLLREPVQRAYSSYTMAVSDGWMEKPFEAIFIALEKHHRGEYDIMFNQFIRLGYYHEQIEMLYRYFPKEQVHVYLFEDLKNSPQNVINPILELLYLEEVESVNVNKVHNKTTQNRSRALSKVIHWLKRENNPLKQTIKKILPGTLFTTLGQKVEAVNKSEVRFPKMEQSIAVELKKHYQSHNERLVELTGLDLTSWE
ncbi:sulfotransferase domain-containing protein [Algivirga pacifica]|uniref:Sulfotransferase n=1 Tax=Algivirga pacifica TaxID=1162670 RepID=A0ABP9DMG7_9BACT